MAKKNKRGPMSETQGEEEGEHRERRKRRKEFYYFHPTGKGTAVIN